MSPAIHKILRRVTGISSLSETARSKAGREVIGTPVYRKGYQRQENPVTISARDAGDAAIWMLAGFATGFAMGCGVGRSRGSLEGSLKGRCQVQYDVDLKFRQGLSIRGLSP
jgi:hypothetical protein